MSEYTSNIKGECHCSNVRFEFETNIKPDNLTIRNCQCRFCKLHGAATARDAKGRVKIFATDKSAVKLYRFATESTDFILCGNCGVYVGAVLTYKDSKYATLNMKLTELNTDKAVPIVYEDEAVEFRIVKRADIFTPVTEYPF